MVLASYDLSAAALALRLLAMESGVPLHDLEGAELSPTEAAEVARARARLEGLPLYLLEARGLTAASLEDRCVRAPCRVDVLGVDYVEAVVRPPSQPVAGAFRDLSALAQQRWLAVVAIARTSPVERAAADEIPAADRVGWIAPDASTGASAAAVILNRHGAKPSCRLRLDVGERPLRRRARRPAPDARLRVSDASRAARPSEARAAAGCQRGAVKTSVRRVRRTPPGSMPRRRNRSPSRSRTASTASSEVPRV